jgi:excisionase family DNA binding protein
MENQTKVDAAHLAGGTAIWNKTVLTFDEVAEYTGLSRSYLYKLTSSGQIPHFKPRSKMLYFNRLELEEWLQQGRVKTSDEINALASIGVKNISKK